MEVPGRFCALILLVVIFGGPEYGFASLKQVLLERGFFDYLCEDPSPSVYCTEQLLAINTVFTRSVAVFALLSIPIGVFTDLTSPARCCLYGAVINCIGGLGVILLGPIRFLGPFIFLFYTLMLVGSNIIYFSVFTFESQIPSNLVSFGIVLKSSFSTFATTAWDFSTIMFAVLGSLFHRFNSTSAFYLIYCGYFVIGAVLTVLLGSALPKSTPDSKKEAGYSFVFTFTVLSTILACSCFGLFTNVMMAVVQESLISLFKSDIDWMLSFWNYVFPMAPVITAPFMAMVEKRIRFTHISLWPLRQFIPFVFVGLFGLLYSFDSRVFWCCAAFCGIIMRALLWTASLNMATGCLGDLVPSRFIGLSFSAAGLSTLFFDQSLEYLFDKFGYRPVTQVSCLAIGLTTLLWMFGSTEGHVNKVRKRCGGAPFQRDTEVEPLLDVQSSS